jgi:hypothetical protein
MEVLMGTAYARRGAAATSSDVTDGLISKYTFNGGNANPDVGSYTGTPNRAFALTNGVKGEANGAYYFGPTIGQVVFTNFFDVFGGTNAGSFSWWEKPATVFNNSVANQSYHVGVEASGTFGHIKWTDNKRYCGIYSGADDDRVALTLTTNLWAVGVWRHWCVTWTNTGSTIVYVDGVSVVTNAVATKGRTYATDPLTLGSFQASAAYPYNGALDNIRTYSIMLSPSQVTTIYNAEKP